jgi:hypothetical protein
MGKRKERERVHRKKNSGHAQACLATISDLRTNYSSLAPSGGLQAADGGTHDNKDSEAQWVRVQRTSISSLIRSVLYLNPSRSNLTSSLGKCDKMVVSASQVPHWTPLMAAALICVPVSQEGEDGDIATTRGGTSSNPQHWATSPGS